jgi:methylated-DNA-[protein]-cysteine S-methyltransferase
MGPQPGSGPETPGGMRPGAVAGRPREHYRLIDTAVGPCGFVWNSDGLRRLQLPEADAMMTEKRLRSGLHFAAIRAGPAETPVSIIQVMANVQRYLAGEPVGFAAVVLDLGDVGAFHRRVYEAARTVGWGETASYRELAARAGSPGAARAVGQALAQNPIAIIVPCHRILAGDGRPGGFSAHGGVDAKQRLLALEGVRPAAPRLPGL